MYIERPSWFENIVKYFKDKGMVVHKIKVEDETILTILKIKGK